MKSVSEEQYNTLWNKLQVVRAAVDHHKPDAARYALDSCEILLAGLPSIPATSPLEPRKIITLPWGKQ